MIYFSLMHRFFEEEIVQIYVLSEHRSTWNVSITDIFQLNASSFSEEIVQIPFMFLEAATPK